MRQNQRFGAERRVKQRGDFLRIQSRGFKTRSPHFLVAVVKHPPATEIAKPSRLGITITTKIDKRSARRNRLKRRIREIFRRCGCLKPGADIVVIAQQGSTELEFVQVKEELAELARRARLAKTRPDHGAKG